MRADVIARITERTRIADLHLRGQNWFGRAANRMGLYTANSVDWLTGWADDDRAIFLGATTAGLMRGAAYGLLATIFIAAFVQLGSMATPLLLTLMATGAVGYGTYDGQRKLERRLNNNDPTFSDEIAEKFGATPDNTISATRNAAKAASFAIREDTRRSEVPPLER